MVCLPSDDILGSTGVSVLLTLTTPTAIEDVAQRRLLEAGFTQQVGQMYEITSAGTEKLEQKGEKPDIDDISL
jgi:ABC-type tungstate transport system permease subunit